MAEDTARDLRGVLDRVKKAGDGEDQVNVGEILETVGQHSFGPILIVISLIAFTPLGAVRPGVACERSSSCSSRVRFFSASGTSGCPRQSSDGIWNGRNSPGASASRAKPRGRWTPF